MTQEESRSQALVNPSIDWSAVLHLIKRMKDHSDASSQSSSEGSALGEHATHDYQPECWEAE